MVPLWSLVTMEWLVTFRMAVDSPGGSGRGGLSVDPAPRGVEGVPCGVPPTVDVGPIRPRGSSEATSFFSSWDVSTVGLIAAVSGGLIAIGSTEDMCIVVRADGSLLYFKTPILSRGGVAPDEDAVPDGVKPMRVVPTCP